MGAPPRQETEVDLRRKKPYGKEDQGDEADPNDGMRERAVTEFPFDETGEPVKHVSDDTCFRIDIGKDRPGGHGECIRRIQPDAGCGQEEEVQKLAEWYVRSCSHVRSSVFM